MSKYEKTEQENFDFRGEMQLLLHREEIDLPTCVELCIKEGYASELLFRMGFDGHSVLTGILLNDNVSKDDVMGLLTETEEGKAIAFELLYQLVWYSKDPFPADKPSDVAIKGVVKNASSLTAEKMKAICEWLPKSTTPEAFRAYSRSLGVGSGSHLGVSGLFMQGAMFDTLRRFMSRDSALKAANDLSFALAGDVDANRYAFYIENELLGQYAKHRPADQAAVNDYFQVNRAMLEAVRDEHLKRLGSDKYQIGYRETRIPYLFPKTNKSVAEEAFLSDWATSIAMAFMTYLDKPTQPKLKAMGFEPTNVLVSTESFCSGILEHIDGQDSFKERFRGVCVAAFLPRFEPQVRKASDKHKKEFMDTFSTGCDWQLAIKKGGKKFETILADHFGHHDCYAGHLRAESKRKMLGNDLGL